MTLLAHLTTFDLPVTLLAFAAGAAAGFAVAWGIARR